MGGYSLVTGIILLWAESAHSRDLEEGERMSLPVPSGC